jgi:predicted ArsR family transcriptional regulator
LEEILDYLREHGEQLDADIATALGLTLEVVRQHIRHLAAGGEVMTCQITRFRGTSRIEGLSCRVAGFTPPISPGRKPG